MKHKHHIIPRHAGGTDDPSNIVELTVEEHAETHRKLYEQYGRWQDKLAYEGLSGQIPSKEVISKLYKENGKQNVQYCHTRESWKKMSMTKKGSKLTKKHKENISKGLMGRKQTQNQKDTVRNALSKHWWITHPDGNKEKIFNLTAFCREHKLDQGNLSRGSHKKYLCQKI